jgi:hypothetical protein
VSTLFLPIFSLCPGFAMRQGLGIAEIIRAGRVPRSHPSAPSRPIAGLPQRCLTRPFQRRLFHGERARIASFSNTTHATCHHGHDWQGTHACLFPMGPRALRQVRYACATKRHFLWGAGRSRAALELFELLANSLAEALRVPQTKRCDKRKLPERR